MARDTRIRRPTVRRFVCEIRLHVSESASVATYTKQFDAHVVCYRDIKSMLLLTGYPIDGS